MYNDRTVLLPNFKAADQTQTKLRSLKFEQLQGVDVCIRPFANSVIYTYIYIYLTGQLS